MLGNRWWGRIVRERRLCAVLVVAFGIRLAWALWATRTPADPLTDPGRYLDMAVSFSELRWPKIGEYATSWDPAGYPLLLVPLAWISRASGVVSLPLLVSLLNVVAGTATVFLVARLASVWISPRAAVPAAALVAISPPFVYYTSTAFSETVTTAMLLGLLLLITYLDARSTTGAATRWYLLTGALVGFGMLSRATLVVLVVAPALVGRARRGTWRGAGRPTLALVAGALLVLLPWTVASGLGSGFWSPFPAGGASAICSGHRDGATGRGDIVPECHRGSVWDQPSLYAPGEIPEDQLTGEVDEVRWSREATRSGLQWMVTHPVEEIRLSVMKTWWIMGNQRDALNAAQNWSMAPLLGPGPTEILQTLGDAWLWILYIATAVGLVRVHAARRALPLWALPLLLLVAAWSSVGQNRYNHAMLPLFAVVAGAAFARLGRHPEADAASDGEDAREAEVAAPQPVDV